MLAACLLLPVAVPALELNGEMVQGGLIRGQIEAGSQVYLDGEPVRVADSGHFLLGFDRDAEPSAVLKLEYPDGNTEARQLSIRQRDYNIQHIDGLPDRKVSPTAEDLERIRRENELLETARQKARQTGELYIGEDFIWPLSGRISGVYGSQRILNGEPRRPHYGLDIAADKGTPVRAPATGVVAFTHPGMYFNGATVVLDHGHGLTSTYIHLSRIEVEQGEWVDQGQSLGRVGASGRATGPHLHWGMQWFDRHIDPRLLVGRMPE
ncbi:MAG: M23 family metallopeptidase [Gammaproteobacteria bacterium]|nr:M23 family metallopeptidase [Gammaproteobacteria bacterium]